MASEANEKARNESEIFRDTVLLNASPEQVQNMSPSELSVLKGKLGYGYNYGTWSTPREWMPAGSRKQSLLEVDLGARLSSLGIPEAYLENAILYCTRYAVLIALLPTGLGSRLRNMLMKPSSLLVPIYRVLPHLLSICIKNDQTVKAETYLKNLSSENLLQLSNAQRIEIIRELTRINKFCDLNLWSDRPETFFLKKEIDYIPDVTGSDVRPKQEIKTDKYLPLPDDWVAEAGWRAIWLAKDLGPTLLRLGEHIAKIVKEVPHQGSGVTEEAIRRKRRHLALDKMTSHDWTDRNGIRFGTPPFPLSLRIGANTPPLLAGEWPPTHVTHILKLLELLQYAHIFIALLAVGSRISEMLSLESGAVTRSSEGVPFASGLTFKLTQVHEGENRNWPLPEMVLEVIEQQEILREILKQIGFYAEDPSDNTAPSNSLWLRYGNIDEFSATSINDHLRTLVKSIGLSSNPGGQNLSSHRFRKTLARLVALALVGAPKILMDLFGHKSIEMTLYYILSDPIIAAEAKVVSEEMVIMRATTAIENIAEYGGKAAERIQIMVTKERYRLGTDLGAENIRELAEVLTMNGQAWELVRPGIICTKLPGSISPCAKKMGHPEASRCMSSCSNRLEEAYLRRDVDEAISEAINCYKAETEAGNELMQDFWAAQILTNLDRFNDIHEKWIANPIILKIIQSRKSTS